MTEHRYGLSYLQPRRWPSSASSGHCNACINHISENFKEYQLFHFRDEYGRLHINLGDRITAWQIIDMGKPAVTEGWVYRRYPRNVFIYLKYKFVCLFVSLLSHFWLIHFFHLYLLYQPYLGLCQIQCVQSHQRQPMSAVAITACEVQVSAADFQTVPTVATGV